MVPLKPLDLDYSQHVRLHMTARPPAGTPLEDVMDPSFWACHTHRLKPGTIVEVLSQDNVLDCELRVLEVGPTFAKVRLLRNYAPGAAPEKREAPTDIEVGYGGKNDRWRIVHRGQVVKAGLETREDAEKAAEEYRSKFAA